jgi:hypothetical protein
MPLLGTVLFPLADSRRTTISLLGWWEARRLTFNIAVGSAGLFTLLIVRMITWVPPGLPFMFDWRPIVAYAALANICYTFGWALEAAAQRVWGDKCPAFGPALFRQGIAFSVGLTLLPIPIISIGWLARVASFLLR